MILSVGGTRIRITATQTGLGSVKLGVEADPELVRVWREELDPDFGKRRTA